MGYPPDIDEFIERHFAVTDRDAVYTLLDRSTIRTPRVIRSVLFLSNGRMGLFRHYLAASEEDIREVVTHAECVTGVSEMPMPLRDLSQPFGSERNLAAAELARPMTRAAPPKAAAPAAAGHHRALLRRSFVLGHIRYTVATDQPDRRRVRCFRKERNVVTVVSLPLMFVLEQLAERIEVATAN